jgi:predicted MFS family arabinose efflux permease
MAAPASVPPPTGGSAAPMSFATMAKLCVMMFLQFFIWGAWFELGFDYIPKLGFNNDWQLPLIFGAFNVGALVALFFSTQFADRTFAAEKFLAVSHLIGGAAILGLFFIRPEVADPTNKEAVKAATDAAFWPFFGLMLLHSVFYVPTISITNSIAFNAFTNPEKQFGPVRVWGTIGWIAASWPFIFLLVDWAAVAGRQPEEEWLAKMLSTSLTGAAAMEMKRYIFLVAGVASFALAAFSLVLPHTPPKKASGGDTLAWLKALKLLRHPAILVLFVVTFIDAAVHQSFFFWSFTFLGPKADGGAVDLPGHWVGPVMKIGQIAEILTMFALGWVLKTLGWRWTMILGVLGHAVRFAVFAYFPDQVPAILVNAIHGICYAFFFATVYIYVDKTFPKDVRSSAQGLFNVLILGVGPFVANFLCGKLKGMYEMKVQTATDKVVETVDYTIVFQFSMFAALVGAILLAVAFHPKKEMERGEK